MKNKKLVAIIITAALTLTACQSSKANIGTSTEVPGDSTSAEETTVSTSSVETSKEDDVKYTYVCAQYIYYNTADELMKACDIVMSGKVTGISFTVRDGRTNDEVTAQMESDLDKIEAGKADWVDVLGKFYTGFDKMLTKAEKDMEGKRVKIPDEPTDIVCDKCGKPMVIKIGPYGKFLGCSGFPECKNTKRIVNETGGLCPHCGGKMLAKKSKKGKPFFGCENYKDCNFMTWDTPLEDKCPKCGSTLFKKVGKQGQVYCAKDGCGYVRPADEDKKNEN